MSMSGGWKYAIVGVPQESSQTIMLVYFNVEIQVRNIMQRPRFGSKIREMVGAARNLAPRNHLMVWIVKPSGCHCTDGHLTSRVFTEDYQIS